MAAQAGHEVLRDETHAGVSLRAEVRQDFLKVKPTNCLNVSLCHHGHIIADLRDRAKDLLYSIVKYCLDVVADAKAQTDLISGLKEKVEDI